MDDAPENILERHGYNIMKADDSHRPLSNVFHNTFQTNLTS